APPPRGRRRRAVPPPVRASGPWPPVPAPARGRPASAALALARAEPQLPPIVRDAAGQARPSSIALGWRELEVLLALLALEQAALPYPPTRVTLGRATARPPDEVQAVLDDLVRMEVLVCHPPRRRGEPATYARVADFGARTGIERLGDALVLAAVLLGRAPQLARHPVKAATDGGE